MAQVGIEISGSPPPQPQLRPPTKLDKCLVLFALFIALPFVLLYAAGAWLICNKNVIGDLIGDGKIHSAKDRWFPIYQRAVRELQKAARKYAKVPLAIRIRLFIILVPWIIVGVVVPNVRKKPALLTLWKWSLMGAIIVYGHKVISLATQSLIYLLCQKTQLRWWKSVVYFAKGMQRSVNMLLLSLLALLTWVWFFRAKESVTERHVWMGTFATAVLAAVLWVVKTLVLLKWEANTVYNRLYGRIFEAGPQYYFLCHICGWGFQHRRVSQVVEKPSAQGAAMVSRMMENPEQRLYSTVARTNTLKDQHHPKNDKEIRDLETGKKKAKKILFFIGEEQNRQATLHDIKKMTKYFIYLSRESSREDDGTIDVLNPCRKINPRGLPNMYLTEKDLMRAFELEKEDAKLMFLYFTLKNHSSSLISYEDFEKNAVKTHKNCIALGRTLLDATEVSKGLNQVMTSLLTIIVIIAWLLLTNIVSTKFLVLIASPLLAGTVLFGTTAKMYEGIIFSFVNHPFDVGDRCIIDGTELEVKRMNVLSTTFIVIGTREEALYPNLTLASMPIKNLKGEPDPIGSDRIELTLDFKYSKSILDALLNKIKEHIVTAINEEGGNKYEKAPTIIITEIRDQVKIEIQYEHVMNIHETTYTQCLRKKEQKSELLLQFMRFIEEIDKKNGRIGYPILQEDY